NAAAKKLNELNLPSPMGGCWCSVNVANIAPRLGLCALRIRVPQEVLQARVRAIWKQHPDFSAKQVIASLGPEYTLGIGRAWALLRGCRKAAARRDAAQRRIGWHLDCWTADRIRISSIWRRRPDFTAKEVLEKLGPIPVLRIACVRQVLRECLLSSAKLSRKQRLIGRRIYSPWRGRYR